MGTDLDLSTPQTAWDWHQTPCAGTGDTKGQPHPPGTGAAAISSWFTGSCYGGEARTEIHSESQPHLGLNHCEDGIYTSPALRAVHKAAWGPSLTGDIADIADIALPEVFHGRAPPSAG